MKRLFSLVCAAALATAAAADPAEPAQALTLAEAHVLALRNHPRLAAAQVQALIAEQSQRESRAGFFPTVNAYVDGVQAGNENTRILAGGLNNPSIYDRVAGGVAVNQLITDFGRTNNLTAESRLEAKAESQNAVATREQILLNVDLAYYAVLQAQAVLQVANETLSARQILVNQVTALASRQLRSELDVSFSEVAFQEARLLQQKAEGDADASRPR